MSALESLLEQRKEAEAVLKKLKEQEMVIGVRTFPKDQAELKVLIEQYNKIYAFKWGNVNKIIGKRLDVLIAKIITDFRIPMALLKEQMQANQKSPQRDYALHCQQVSQEFVTKYGTVVTFNPIPVSLEILAESLNDLEAAKTKIATDFETVYPDFKFSRIDDNSSLQDMILDNLKNGKLLTVEEKEHRDELIKEMRIVVDKLNSNPMCDLNSRRNNCRNCGVLLDSFYYISCDEYARLETDYEKHTYYTDDSHSGSYSYSCRKQR